MAYIGNRPNFQEFTSDVFDGNGINKEFELSIPHGVPSAALVHLSGVVKTPIVDYEIKSGTILVFNEAPISGENNITVTHLGSPASVGVAYFNHLYREGPITSGTPNLIQYFRQMDTDLIPDEDETRDLGSPDKQWKDLYVSSGSIYIDGERAIAKGEIATSGDFVIKTDNEERIKISPNGNVGVGAIGVSEPGSAGNIFEVNSANEAHVSIYQPGVHRSRIGCKSSDQTLYITNNTLGAGLGEESKSIVVDSSGKVGINKNAPNGRLAVYGVSGDPNAALVVASASDTERVIQLVRGNEPAGTHILFSGRTSPTSYYGAIGLDATGNWHLTTNTSGSFTSGRKLTVLQGGNIGINEATPTAQLHINTGYLYSGSDLPLRIRSTVPHDFFHITGKGELFTGCRGLDASSDTVIAGFYYGWMDTSSWVRLALGWSTGTSESLLISYKRTEARIGLVGQDNTIVLSSTGRVGIKTSPSVPLHVNGVATYNAWGAVVAAFTGTTHSQMQFLTSGGLRAGFETAITVSLDASKPLHPVKSSPFPVI